MGRPKKGGGADRQADTPVTRSPSPQVECPAAAGARPCAEHDPLERAVLSAAVRAVDVDRTRDATSDHDRHSVLRRIDETVRHARPRRRGHRLPARNRTLRTSPTATRSDLLVLSRARGALPGAKAPIVIGVSHNPSNGISRNTPGGLAGRGLRAYLGGSFRTKRNSSPPDQLALTGGLFRAMRFDEANTTYGYGHWIAPQGLVVTSV